MINDKEIRQRFDLLRSDRSFVLQKRGTDGDAIVLSPSIVAQDSGVYWIAGKTLAKSGLDVDSVFRIDTNSGSPPISVYWWVNGEWYQHDDGDALRALGITNPEMFPAEWRLDVPVAGDQLEGGDG